MLNKIVAIFLALMIVFASLETFAAEQTVSQEFGNIKWDYQGNKIPETYWTPWLSIGPYGLVVHQAVRYKLGGCAGLPAQSMSNLQSS